MTKKDYYSILGVAKNAAKKDIEAAYKALSKKFHPDLNPGNKEAEEMMKLINEAKNVLCNPEKRREYDNPKSNIVVSTEPTDAEITEEAIRRAFNL